MSFITIFVVKEINAISREFADVCQNKFALHTVYVGRATLYNNIFSLGLQAPFRTINTQTRAHVVSAITSRLHELTSNNSKIPGLFRYTCVFLQKRIIRLFVLIAFTREKEAIAHIQHDNSALHHMNHTTKYNI